MASRHEPQMSGVELYDELQYHLRMATDCVKSLRTTTQQYAQREHDYRVALSKRLTELRAGGQPVTHLADIARGEPDIARLRMERDIAQGIRDANIEAIQLYKLRARLVEGQINREWSAPEGGTR